MHKYHFKMSITCRYRYAFCEINVFFWGGNNNSSALEFTGNKVTEDAWLLGLSPIYNVRQLTKNSGHINNILVWNTRTFKNLLVKRCIVRTTFPYFMLNRKFTEHGLRGCERNSLFGNVFSSQVIQWNAFRV